MVSYAPLILTFVYDDHFQMHTHLAFLPISFAVRLTPINQVLLVVGVILLSIATIVCIVLIVVAVTVRTHKGNLVSLHYTLYYIRSRLFLIVLVVGCVVATLQQDISVPFECGSLTDLEQSS